MMLILDFDFSSALPYGLSFNYETHSGAHFVWIAKPDAQLQASMLIPHTQHARRPSLRINHCKAPESHHSKQFFELITPCFLDSLPRNSTNTFLATYELPVCSSRMSTMLNERKSKSSTLPHNIGLIVFS